MKFVEKNAGIKFELPKQPQKVEAPVKKEDKKKKQ